jgi:hypothetical protein
MPKNKRKIWLPEDIKYLIGNYSNTRNDILCDVLARPLHSIYSMAHKLKLSKSEEYLELNKCGRFYKGIANNGIQYRFKKGHIPVNKGKKMPIDIKEKVAHTFFSKGHLPVNTLYDGAITTRRDKNGHNYKWIRLSKANWRMLQVYNWEKLHGPIPKDRIIVAKDGNSLNCDPENWMLIDRITHLERNSGRQELTDNYVISKLSPRNKQLREIVKQSPELIEMKRNQLKLNRELHERNN